MFLHVVCPAAYGNAGVFGGFGQDIKLINSTDVQMVSEDILITPGLVKVTRDGKTYDAEKADYSCYFKLKNLSDHPVAVQVGFPLDSQFFSQPHYDTNNLTQVTNLYQFVVLEGRSSYPVRYSREDKDKKFKTIFLWDMKFAPKELKELQITYTMPFSIGAAATSREGRKSFSYAKQWYRYFEGCSTEGFGYVTETGKSWGGKIEHARFRVDLRTFETFLKQRGLREDMRWTAEKEAALEKNENEREAKMQLWREQEVERNPGFKKEMEAARLRQELFRKQMKQERAARSPIANPAFFREVTPEGWKDAGDGLIVWDLADYRPAKPITVSYDFIFCMPQTKDDAKQLIDRIFKGTLTEEDAQDLEDIIKAFYGFKVDNPRIDSFLQNQKWYPTNGQENLPSGIIETIEDARGKE